MIKIVTPIHSHIVVCDVTLSVHPHWASWKVCLTTVGISRTRDFWDHKHHKTVTYCMTYDWWHWFLVSNIAVPVPSLASLYILPVRLFVCLFASIRFLNRPVKIPCTCSEFINY
jgi:hypothetical protein